MQGSGPACCPVPTVLKNDDYRIWNKPVRAVADGTVESWSDGMDDNMVLGEFPDPTPSPVRRQQHYDQARH